jgi:hypothetical protein
MFVLVYDARPPLGVHVASPVAQTFMLAEIAQAQRVSEDSHVRGKLVVVAG